VLIAIFLINAGFGDQLHRKVSYMPLGRGNEKD
jgi:hypothetical protein